MGDAGEVDGASVVAGGEAPEVFEPSGAPLDAVAHFVSGCVMRDRDLAGAAGGDHRLGSHVGGDRSYGLAVIGFVGEHGIDLLPLSKAGA